MKQQLAQTIKQGRIVVAGETTPVSERIWNEHPTYPGVYLKHLLTGEDTQGRFSSHLIRVRQGCEIGLHVHEGKMELHEVVQGHGQCMLQGETIAYESGVASLIPADAPHRLLATDEDLYLLAKFVPALL